MIKRIYIHNFRCMENFELDLGELSSSLLIGKNGSGKSTVGHVLRIFQAIGRGHNRTSDLVNESDATQNRTNSPMRFELELDIDGRKFKYILVLELPEKFKEYRVKEESLNVDGEIVFKRFEAQVMLTRNGKNSEAEFMVDWHLIALPIIHEQSQTDPLYIFKNWIARMVILSPVPEQMNGESNGETFFPERDGSNFANWFTGIVSAYPASYSDIDRHLRYILPDLQDILNEKTGKESKNIIVRFKNDRNGLNVPFELLSDGEKCFFLNAVVIAAEKYSGSLFCFWDEPDAFLDMSEIQHFVIELRRNFTEGSQILVTSHDPETIRCFSETNTLLFSRSNHLEPVRARKLEDMEYLGDKVNALLNGDI